MKIYTVPELTALLHSDPGTIYQHINKGRLKAFKSGRSWLVEQSDLDEFIYNRKQCALQEAQAERKRKCLSTKETVFGRLTLLPQAGKELDDLLKPKTKKQHKNCMTN